MTTPPAPDPLSGLEASLTELEACLPAIYTLLGRLDRTLVDEEELFSTDKVRNPVIELLLEALDDPESLVPVAGTLSPPHITASEDFQVRLTRLVDRRLNVTFDTAANRVLLRSIDVAVLGLSRHLHAPGLPAGLERRLRRARSALIAMRSHADTGDIGPMTPGDLMDRSLRYAPRYRPVLAMHRVSRALRGV